MCNENGSLVKLFLTPVIVLLLFSSVYGQKWGKVTDEEWNLAAPVDYPEANAVILFDIGRMEVSPERVELKRHVRIKILNKAGIEEVGDVGFSYDKDDKIRGLKAHTITPDGKKHKVGKKEFYTKSFGGRKYKTFAFPSLDSGCIIEYKYTNSNKRLHRLDAWYFQSDIYTKYSEFSLILWPGFVYSSATVQIPAEYQNAKTEYLPNLDDLDGRRNQKYTWGLHDLPPVKDEPYMSFRENYLAAIYNQLVSYETPHYRFDYIKGWSDIGEKFQFYIDDYINEKGTIEKLIDSLISGINDNLEKAKTIYEYVSREYKTKDNEKGYYFNHDKLSGLLVGKSGAGDEKNILLIQMLNAADLQAWPVLIGTRDKAVFNPKLYQAQQFNRIIALVNLNPEYYYLDATSEYCPFGFLPPESRATGGLLVDDKNSELVKIIINDPNTFRRDVTDMHVNHDGTVTCSTSVQFCGYFASHYGKRCDEKKAAEFVEDYFLDKLDVSYRMNDPCFKHDSLDRLEMNVTYSLDDYVRQLDNNLVIKPVQYYFRENPFKSENRFFPVDFNYPFIYQNMVRISFEDSVISRTLPEPIQLEIPGGSFKRECMYDGNNVIVNSQLAINKPFFPQNFYGRLRDFFIQATAAAEDEVIVGIASK